MVILKPADTVDGSNLTTEQLHDGPFASLFGHSIDGIEPATANYDPELQLEVCPESREPVNKITSRPDGTLTIAPENRYAWTWTLVVIKGKFLWDLNVDL